MKREPIKFHNVIHEDNRIIVPRCLKVLYGNGMFFWTITDSYKVQVMANDYGANVSESVCYTLSTYEALHKIVNFSLYQACFERQRLEFGGGNKTRRKSEVFCSTIEGKVGELVFIIACLDSGKFIPGPLDLCSYKRGTWDNHDIVVNNKIYQIKTAKHIANLLMFESDGYKDVSYCEADYVFLCRTNILEVLKPILNKISCDTHKIEQETDWITDFLIRHKFSMEVVGYVGKNDIKKCVKRGERIRQGELLGRQKMQADNIYIVSGDLKKIRGIDND